MRTVRYVLLLLFFLLSSSCDLFLGMPHIRENPDDLIRQLSRPVAAAPDQSSVKLRFVWVPPFRWASSEDTIDEVVLVWSDKRFPDSRTPTFLNGYSAQSFSDTGYHEVVVSSLSPETAIYAALFAHTERGWFSPQYALKETPAAAPVIQGPDIFLYGSVYAFYIDYMNPESFQAWEETTTSVSIGTNATSENDGVIYFPSTIAADAYCTSALLNITSSDAVQAEIYPVVLEWKPFDDGGEEALYWFQNRFIDEDMKVTFTLANGLNNVDVTNLMPVVQAADTWGFLFRLVNDGDTADLSIDASLTLDISYID